MIRQPPRSTQSRSSAASDVYKRQISNTSQKDLGSFFKYLCQKLKQNFFFLRSHRYIFDVVMLNSFCVFFEFIKVFILISFQLVFQSNILLIKKFFTNIK
eukprot:TRINITY_DN22223_c0_g1_i1.p2 TRINITY_DN22223_c0_g1~~TRINITY_DN22223_c0_g1_i1.p2  ORF type:complete len:100 (-),score=12.75 TRINITY_DN22223_c0_g1_i1:24-323(-)